MSNDWRGGAVSKKAVSKKAGIIRAGFVGTAVVMQLMLIALLIWMIKERAIFVYVLIQIFSWISVILLVGKNKDTSYTMAWLIIIVILPAFGFILYVLWGRSSSRGRRNDKMKAVVAEGKVFLKKDTNAYRDFIHLHPMRKRFADFLGKEGFPLYENTKCDYYPLGELQFEAMIEDMEKAEKFIFLEYFILHSGELWDKISELLIRKAAQGVEVRLMYDDLGSITTAPDNLIRELREKNINVIRFNPVHKSISRFSMNYRNHQKITIIDGSIGYTGGTNIADEYANMYKRLGHWKDTAIRLEGDAVWSLTMIFLQMWESENNDCLDYEKYRSNVVSDEPGFYQPFADGPFNNPNNPAEVMYNTIIYNAKEYVYITTPYLVVDDSMMDALCTAARGGIDVRIITPKRWDHWYVNMVTRSNYGELMKAGVKIYEYSPGYIHAKTILSDDDHAVTGSINMDYRSFNLHFENGVWICGSPVLDDIKQDIMETFAVSEKIDFEEWSRRPWYIKTVEALLRPFAVLL